MLLVCVILVHVQPVVYQRTDVDTLGVPVAVQRNEAALLCRLHQIAECSTGQVVVVFALLFDGVPHELRPSLQQFLGGGQHLFAQVQHGRNVSQR